MSSRHDISDEDWNRIAPFLPGQAGGHGGVGFGTRLFVNAIIYIPVTGIAWADLPRWYGNFE
jgi:transposase